MLASSLTATDDREGVLGSSAMSLISDYRKIFETQEATSAGLRDEAHRIRFEVYCREFAFENSAEHADGLEKDEYDAHSRHCLLLHKPSQTYAGCVRVILAKPETPTTSFPFEKCCARAFWRDKVDVANLPRDTFGEISRLAIRRPFRRRRGERPHPDGFSNLVNPLPGVDRRHMPKMVLGLYLAAAAVGLSNGLESVFAMMEPRLARHLAVAGIRFEQVSDLVDHHGPRAAFQITRQSLFGCIRPELRELLEVISADLVTSACVTQHSPATQVA